MKHAEPFIATREHHEQELAEDYVELIADLIEESGQARTCDLATRLGVTHVTVVRTVRRLQQKGYLDTEPHRPVLLTEKGRKLAVQSKARHQLLVQFLLSIGVSPSTAAVDAEGMEHHVSDETLSAMRASLQRATPLWKFVELKNLYSVHFSANPNYRRDL